MLIIPELQLNIIMAPRTASRSLADAVKTRYQTAFQPFRHMERDGTPEAYRDFQVLSVVRDPLERLASLWSFLRNMAPHNSDPELHLQFRAAAQEDLADWITGSVFAFCCEGSVNPDLDQYYSGLRPGPITRRPQADWIRPDIGPAELLPFERLDLLERRLDITLPHANWAPKYLDEIHAAASDAKVIDHINRFHGCDAPLLEQAANHAAEVGANVSPQPC